MKTKSNKKQKLLSIFLFIIYFALLTWVILFKMSLHLEDIPNMTRHINWIPFGDSAIVNGQIDKSEWLLNLLIYVPFGVLLTMLLPKMRFGTKLLIVFLSSIGFEALQYYFSIGGTDITDVINNTAGGFIGLVMYDLLELIFRDKGRLNKGLNFLGSIAVLAFIGFVGYLFYMNR